VFLTSDTACEALVSRNKPSGQINNVKNGFVKNGTTLKLRSLVKKKSLNPEDIKEPSQISKNMTVDKTILTKAIPNKDLSLEKKSIIYPRSRSITSFKSFSSKNLRDFMVRLPQIPIQAERSKLEATTLASNMADSLKILNEKYAFNLGNRTASKKRLPHNDSGSQILTERAFIHTKSESVNLHKYQNNGIFLSLDMRVKKQRNDSTDNFPESMMN